MLSRETITNWFHVPGVQTGLCLLILFTFVGIGTWYFERNGFGRATMWLQRLRENISTPNGIINSADFTQRDDERLREQLSELKNREGFHADVMIFFYSRYYMAIIMFPLLSALSAIMLFFISKSGWKEANNRLIAIFIVGSAAAVYFGALPGMFKLEDNIADNKNLFLQYRGLENEIASFLVTQEDLTGKKEPAAGFIHHIDEQMAKLNSLAVGFDYSKIPTNFIPDSARSSSANVNTNGSKGKTNNQP